MRWLMLLIVALPLAPAHAQPPDELSPREKAEAVRLIDQLDADSFTDREEAQQRLRELGADVIPLLEEAEKTGTPEVRFRAAALLKVVRLDPLEAYCALPDEMLNLEHGMWLIARIIDPAADRKAMNAQLDEIAAKVREKLGKDITPAEADPAKVVEAIRAVLFDELKFIGNKEDFSNPHNSSLPRVLATRKGLPITLAHLVIAVARRLDVPIVGIPAAGLYLVKYEGAKAPAGFANDDIYFFPYEAGRVLSREERLKLYPSHDPDVMVPPDTSRGALMRMLRNLTTALDHGRGSDEQMQQALKMLELLESHAEKAAR